jgi:hypothetical protein
MQVETVKRFDRLTLRRVHFMVWSFATTLTVGRIVMVAIKFYQIVFSFLIIDAPHI